MISHDRLSGSPPRHSMILLLQLVQIRGRAGQSCLFRAQVILRMEGFHSSRYRQDAPRRGGRIRIGRAVAVVPFEL